MPNPPEMAASAPTATPWTGHVRPAGPITRAMVHARTGDLAVLAGRGRQLITHADYLRARREVTGETEVKRQDALLDSFARPGRRTSRKSCVPVATAARAAGAVFHRSSGAGSGG